MKVCLNCGNENVNEAIYCKNCGDKLTTDGVLSDISSASNANPAQPPFKEAVSTQMPVRPVAPSNMDGARIPEYSDNYELPPYSPMPMNTASRIPRTALVLIMLLLVVVAVMGTVIVFQLLPKENVGDQSFLSSSEVTSELELASSSVVSPSAEPSPSPEPASEAVKAAAGRDYYILPESSTRLLTYRDIENLTEQDMMLARNEIYARHGRRFLDSTIQQYFNAQAWYKGTIEPSAFSESALSSIEASNVQFIKSYEDGGTSMQPPEQAPDSDIIPEGGVNVFIGTGPQYLIDSVSLNPKEVWYQDGKLYANMYVVNGFSHNVYDVVVKNISLSNDSGLIAEANFGLLENVTIGANSYIEWGFVFSGDQIKQANGDLASGLEYNSSTSYRW